MHDDAFYVPPELLAAWRERDPVALLRARLLAAGGAFDEAADEALCSEVAREVDVAVELALASAVARSGDARRRRLPLTARRRGRAQRRSGLP